MTEKNETPWLEPGVGTLADKARNMGATPQAAMEADLMKAAALMSLAITFKRMLDLVEPLGRAAIAEMEAEKAARKKGAK